MNMGSERPRRVKRAGGREIECTEVGSEWAPGHIYGEGLGCGKSKRSEGRGKRKREQGEGRTAGSKTAESPSNRMMSSGA